MEPVQVPVSKAAHEVASLLSSLVVETKKALDDGFQPGSDLPVVVLALVTKLPAAVADFSQLGPEFKQDPEQFLNAFLIEASKIVGALVKKA